jgi:hypothetical protein
MIKVTVFDEGKYEPSNEFQFRVKEFKEKNWIEKGIKGAKGIAKTLRISVSDCPETYGVYLFLPFYMVLLGIFHKEVTITALILSFLSFLATLLSFNRRIGKESSRMLFKLSLLLLATSHYISHLRPLTLSYIFPILYIYKTHENGNRELNIYIFSLILLFYSAFFEDPATVLFSIILTLIFFKAPSIPPIKSISNQNLPQELSTISSEDQKSSPLINILTCLNNSITLLNSSEPSESIKKSTESLKKALKILTKNSNIYSPDLKKFTKNLDIEDKIFIEENTLTSKFGFSNTSPATPHQSELIYGVSELAGILKQIGKDWNFNTIFVSSLTGNFPLFTCGEYIFAYYNFYQVFTIHPDTARAFLRKVEGKYNFNPYHNSCHAADVMNSFLFLINSIIGKIPSVELFSCILACLGHDIGHPGTNNRFMVQTKHDLAVHYNDISVLENMHARDLFITMNDTSCNIISGVKDYWLLRKVIVELILSTDMAKHFEFLASGKSSKSIQEKLESFNDRLEIYKLGIKSSDISHTAKTLEVHKQWCKLLIQEFFSQGDKEKELGLPVSMYCDRKNTDVHKSQAGFLANIALPLFVKMQSTMQSEEIEINCVSQMRRNILYWQKRKDNGRNSTLTISDVEMLRPEFRRTTLTRPLKPV